MTDPHQAQIHLVFSYGTLQLPSVQTSTFGGLVPGRAATISGYVSAPLTITDPEVIARSGTDQHPILTRTADPGDRIDGTVLSLTTDQLAAADAYEVSDYRRVEVELDSGETAWVYVFAEP